MSELVIVGVYAWCRN